MGQAQNTNVPPGLSPGDECYTSGGEQVQYCGMLNQMAYIYRTFLHPDGSPAYDSWPSAYGGRLFSEPPVAQVHEEVAEALAELKAVLDTRNEARKECEAAQQKVLNMKALAEKHDALRDLVDYLEGRITHIVIIPSYGAPSIALLDSILTGTGDSHDKWQRAIGLFAVPNLAQVPDRRRVVSWRSSHYRDGSESWTEFIPCRSEVEARRRVRAQVDEKAREWRQDGKLPYWFAEVATKFPWLDLPSDVAEAMRKQRLDSLTSACDKARKDFHEVEAALAEAEAERETT